MTSKQYIGKLGENKSLEYLQENFYQIIEKNFFCRYGEIDIIALDKKQNELAFIEVKTRTNLSYGMPIESINNKKIKNIKKVINYYIINKKLKNINIRIDAIEVLVKENKCIIHHVKQIV